ncbi:hypothetical protein K4F52_006676 [Lecanicillium sp. MT-2017a]|nr:hypothetical protein K4F52_006676 [Lecanicillium sp. MT-2017a]
MPHRLSDPAVSPPRLSAVSKAGPHPMSEVTQALEIARESPDGAQDPTVFKMLDQALAHIWSKVQAQPDDYVMTRDEFSVFNYFQHRFVGDKTAIACRKRYWDNLKA